MPIGQGPEYSCRNPAPHAGSLEAHCLNGRVSAVAYSFGANHMHKAYLPYCRPFIGEEEIAEVIDTLRNGWLTTGPKVRQFEEEFCAYLDVAHAVAVASCTAGLQLALVALGVGEGDEVIVPTMTFCSTANVVVHTGAKPILVDVKPDFQISAEAVARAVTPRTRAIIPVHYGGQACSIDEILAIARKHNLYVIEDAAHAVGAEYSGRKIGSHGDAVVFSFYTTKNLTTGEGGMVTTSSADLADRIRRLALHGMSRDAWKRYSKEASWSYDVLDAGFKYNMMDIQAALGIHQLRRLDTLNARRSAIADRYDAAFAEFPELCLPPRAADRNHVRHLYPVQIVDSPSLSRSSFMEALSESGIGASVHFIPVHRHTFYRTAYGYRSEDFPVAEALYCGLVSLPLYPAMADSDTEAVIEAVRNIVKRSRVLQADAASTSGTLVSQS